MTNAGAVSHSMGLKKKMGLAPKTKTFGTPKAPTKKVVVKNPLKKGK